MRKSTTLLAAGLTAALSFGLVALPSHAASVKDSDGSTSVKVAIKDVVSKKGTFQVKKWVTVSVAPPASYTNSRGELVESRWTVNLNDGYASDVSCNLDFFRSPGTIGEYNTGAGTIVWNLPKTKGLTKKNGTTYYWGSGKCKVDASITVQRDGDYTLGIDSYYKTFDLKTSYRNQTAPKVTISASKSVKKNKSFTVSGKATAASPKHLYKSKAVKKGTKVAVQFQKNGKGAWKTIKNTKVGKSGKWSTTVKIKAKGKLRAVVAATNTTSKKASSSKLVKLRK